MAQHASSMTFKNMPEKFFQKLQSFKKYLRQSLVFMRNSALRERLNFYFLVAYC